MKVAVAIVVDEQQRILITRRPLHVSHGGLWEFPGGKLEDNETPWDALTRELKEETGLEVHDGEFLGEVQHTYPKHTVVLLVYRIANFQGQASALEGQMDLRWVSYQDLSTFNFPEANQHILEKVGLAFSASQSNSRHCEQSEAI